MTLTPEQARHAAAMYTARAEGKECEEQDKHGETGWFPWTGAGFFPDARNYRVKPEPEPVVNEWWFNINTLGVVYLHDTETSARKTAEDNGVNTYKEVAVHVVRADSIKIAELVTDEQIERAHWTVRWGTHSVLPSLKKFLEALDTVREGK
jgi:hypothetical protein